MLSDDAGGAIECTYKKYDKYTLTPGHNGLIQLSVVTARPMITQLTPTLKTDNHY